MLYILQTKNGSLATDIISFLRWSEENLDGRVVQIGGRGDKIFDIQFENLISTYECYEILESKSKMCPFRFALFSDTDVLRISNMFKEKIESVKTINVEAENITPYICRNLRRICNIDCDEDTIGNALVSSINQGFKGSFQDAVVKYLTTPRPEGNQRFPKLGF